MATTVTKQSLIGEVLNLDEGTAPFFLAIGMHCLGCPSAQSETIEEACMVHGTDADALVNQLNEYLASR